ncbi:MAG: lytic murein transglycosylase [Candidatus Yanofskybacteria bacterium]|nr:lytic murein transglycosylase [Candidatus Yanofskybacteria bacterium]
MDTTHKGILRISLLAVLFAFYAIGSVAHAAIQDEIEARNRQIEQLQKQIEEYQHQIESQQSKKATLQGEISKLNAIINQVTLEIQSLNHSIVRTSLEIEDTENKITDAETELDKNHQTLAKYVRIAYETDKVSLTEVLLNNENLSDFFTNINNLQNTQESLRQTIEDIKNLKDELGQQKDSLEDKQTELERAKRLQEIEKSNLDGNKSQKNQILKDTQGQETKFQELVKKSQKDIEALKAQVTYLQLNGVSVEDAVKFGNLAALRAGIRPAYLIAVLEVESGLGRNVGRCNRAEDPPTKHWESIMHTRDHQPFQTITSQLGLDVNSTAVSCPQYVNGKQYGYGGAMGPAQFIPSTWVAYAADVARIVGRSLANPWNIEDAFTASATKLSRAGATEQTRAAEIAASKAYYSGNSKCSTSSCNSYANAIQRKAEEIAKNL